MPTGVGYQAKIWVSSVYSAFFINATHHFTSGSCFLILVEEAGGVVTGSRAQPLNFGFGRALGENYDVAAGKDVHALVLDAIQKARATIRTYMIPIGKISRCGNFMRIYYASGIFAVHKVCTQEKVQVVTSGGLSTVLWAVCPEWLSLPRARLTCFPTRTQICVTMLPK